MLEIASAKNTIDEFLKAFESVITIFVKLKEENDLERTAIKEQVEQALRTIGTKMAQLRPGIDGKDYILTDADKRKIASLIDVPVVERHTETIIKEQPVVKEVALTDTADDIRNKLELLPDGDKLPIEAIDGLEEALAALKKLRTTSGSGPAVLAATRGAVKAYDLSALLDGVTTTFALPAFWRVLEVKSTSSPSVFRPGTDYTTDASAMTITFTSQIDPSTILAQPQTLMVLYAEP